MSVELCEEANLSEAAISAHNVVLATDTINLFAAKEEALLSLGDTCRKVGSSLILADAAGLAGRVFCDFGEKFTVNDKDGVEPKEPFEI